MHHRVHRPTTSTFRDGSRDRVSLNRRQLFFMKKVMSELARFVWVQKKFWLVPVLFFLILMLALVVLSTKGGVVAPFIYPIF